MKFFSYIVLLSIPLACGSDSNSLETPAIDDYYYNEDISTKGSSLQFEEQVNDLEQQQQPKIIKNAFLRFETQNLNDTYSNISTFVNAQNGYILNDNSRRNYDTDVRTIEIKVPAANFQQLIDAISAQVSYFDTKSISSSDVTEEFIDIEARLGAKKNLELRYLELLNKANNVKDILEIEKEASKIREDIEAHEGRLKYLQSNVTMSTVKIEFYKQTVSSVASRSYGSKMVDAIKSGFNGLSLFILGILHIWPFILILFIGVFLLRRYLKKQKNK